MKPTFLIIGAMKCGTTSLCAYLRQHPEIFIPSHKDIYFFSNDDVYSKGWDWYIQHFEEGKGCKAIGEGTDNYSKVWEFPHSSKRIKKHLPSAKIIYIVRNPIRQIESAWAHMKLMNGESLSFGQAIFHRKFYIDNCRYLKQINIYRKIYNDKNIRVLFLEDLVNDEEKTLRSLFEFVGVDSFFKVSDTAPRNTRKDKYGDRPVTKALKKIPGIDNLSYIFPDWVWGKIKPLFKWRMNNTPEWEQANKIRFIDLIENETHEFLSLYGKPQNFWSLD